MRALDIEEARYKTAAHIELGQAAYVAATATDITGTVNHVLFLQPGRQ